MTTAADLERIHALMIKHYRFEDDTFPGVAGLDAAATTRFALRHLAMHFTKEAGQYAALVEPSDHGDAIDTEALKRQAPKMFATLMKMIQVIGMSPADLVATTASKYESMDKAA